VAGDFVFTVGGYHAAFKVPDHYPRPDRPKRFWDVGDGLKILGEAYLAVATKVCMLGGLLEAVLELVRKLLQKQNILRLTDSRVLWVHTSVLTRIYLSLTNHSISTELVGVRFTLDLLLVTIHISVDISAELTLYGPLFGGDVYDNFWGQ
jgi:hypothetical protein